MLKEEATKFRSLVMRAAYLAQDRGDIAEATKALAQRMKDPTIVKMCVVLPQDNSVYYKAKKAH